MKGDSNALTSLDPPDPRQTAVVLLAIDGRIPCAYFYETTHERI
jgi:hypothetical protein